MAKATLSTNYIDDILHESAGGKRKYRMNYNEDGTVSFDDVTVYEQEGSDYGAGDINRTNEAVNQSFDKNKLIRDMDAINAITQEGYAPDALALKEVNESLQADNGQGFQFAYDSASGKYGYKAEVEGADTFFPFSKELVEQTVTNTITYKNNNEIKTTFTFSNLREVIAIKSFAISSGSGRYFYIVPQSGKGVTISGNTITLWVVNYSGSANFTITAVGYAN
jgi:hypothetical protein